MKYIVQQNETVLEALVKMSPDSSKTTLRSWLKDERIALDSQMVKIGSTPVEKGQTLTLGSKSQPCKINILYQDCHLVVIEKPAGLLSVASHYEKQKTAHSFLKEIHKPLPVYPVHRIDRETSGVMIFALTEEARDNLKDLFECHEIKRQYEAIVEGHLEPSKGHWKSYLYEDKNYTVHSVDEPERGKKAITHFEVISIRKKTSHVTFTLETGRKNQIRVHCQDAGYPVLGDKKYGPCSISCKRLCLHATLLELTHPITGKWLSFRSPSPF